MSNVLTISIIIKMAGTKIKDEFKELVSPFLKSKFSETEKKYGKLSKEYEALEKQYI